MGCMSQFWRVRASGRIGEIVRHDPDDTLLTYKLKFSDGIVPEMDWFGQSSVEEEEDWFSVTENESSADLECLKCPNGHLITYDDNQDREDDYGIICEGCDTKLGKAVGAHYTCRPCRWDLCPVCHTTALARRQTEACINADLNTCQCCSEAIDHNGVVDKRGMQCHQCFKCTHIGCATAWNAKGNARCPSCRNVSFGYAALIRERYENAYENPGAGTTRSCGTTNSRAHVQTNSLAPTC